MSDNNQANVVQFSNNPQPEQKPRIKRENPRPTKVIPTERITFQKQVSLLRAYAAAGVKGKAVRVADAADMAKMSVTTVSVTNGFFTSVGLIQRNELGILPSTEVVDFGKAYEWQPETAGHKLAPIIKQTWFAQSLLRKLTLYPMRQEQAVMELAQEASAPPRYKNQVKMLLDYLELAGLIIRENDTIRRNSEFPESVTDGDSEPTEPIENNQMEKPENTYRQNAVAPTPKTASANPFNMTGGMIRFNIAIEVNMQEFENWEADKVAAFFNGMAQVIAAKTAAERENNK